MLSPAIIHDPEALAQALKQRRKELNATQEELAEIYGVSRYTIVDAESGKGDPKLSTVLKLLNGLGMSLMAVPNQLTDQIAMMDPVDREVEAPDIGISEWEFDAEMEP